MIHEVSVISMLNAFANIHYGYRLFHLLYFGDSFFGFFQAINSLAQQSSSDWQEHTSTDGRRLVIILPVFLVISIGIILQAKYFHYIDLTFLFVMTCYSEPCTFRLCPLRLLMTFCVHVSILSVHFLSLQILLQQKNQTICLG